MNKRLTKPHEKNERLNSPLGLLGVPPDCPSIQRLLQNGGTVIIVNGDATIIRDRGRPKSLPQ